jgi:transglutaminase-like putative cysteine protease
MTRRDFRGSVDTPRPAAAWVMSVVASATLWVTELLPIWVVLIQIVAFSASYATRLAPPDFRRSPIWLNVGMLAITTVTIRSALAGNPATVSLAYFTALAQGLQLLDARPRRSEFLLVALALFQVILASNLTDSILFPPLVLLFLVSVTWTLLVHTLHMEATEAGDPSAATRAIRADLAQMTAMATCGCLILALLLFLALPRVKTSMLRGSFPSGLALSGFSDRVRLGDAGRIRKDHSIVLRVEALDGELPDPGDAYWRGLVFDAFDGQNWSVSGAEHRSARQMVTGIGRFGIALAPEAAEPEIAQRIIREPVEAGVLFTPGQVQRIQGPFQGLERDANGALYLAGPESDRIRYTVWSRASERRADLLRADRASPPIEPAAGGRRPTARYAALPPLDPRIAALADALVAGATNDFDRALRLQEQLRELGRYTDEPPPRGDAQTSPIEAFLLDGLEGHCEYFASAMVVLARSQGLPARLVNGYAGGVANSVGNFIEVTNADAHAWVEIHFERAGWVRFDPTPPDQRLRAMDGVSLWSRVSQFGSALELWWFQRIVDFDSADQISALRGLWLAWKGGAENDTKPADASTPQVAESGDWRRRLERAPPVLFVGLALGALFWIQHRRHAPNDGVPPSYRRALRLLAGRGYRRHETSSARDFARRMGQELPDAAAIAFDQITEHYLAERFGAIETPDLAAELAVLERTVERMRLGNQAHVR